MIGEESPGVWTGIWNEYRRNDKDAYWYQYGVPASIKNLDDNSQFKAEDVAFRFETVNCLIVKKKNCFVKQPELT